MEQHAAGRELLELLSVDQDSIRIAWGTACAWHVHGMCMFTACARHGQGMGMACVRHVYGMCTACVRHVHRSSSSLRLTGTHHSDLRWFWHRPGSQPRLPARTVQAGTCTACGPAHAAHGTRRTARVARASVYLSARLSSRWSRRLWRRSKRGYSGGAISMPRVRAPRWREVSTSPSVAAARVSACSTCSSRGSRACPRLARPPCGERRVAWAQARRVLQSPRRNEPRGRAHSDSIMHADVP